MNISPEDFKNKNEAEKNQILESLLEQLKGKRSSFKAYKDESYKEIIEIPCYNVNRPLLKKSGRICEYELSFIFNWIPQGEDKTIIIKNIDEDYKKLYHFKMGHCIDCMQDSLEWDYGDKRFIYFCNACNIEQAFFCKHCKYDDYE